MFANRSEAGRKLADALARFQGRRDVLVLALPRGGVPVAFQVAGALKLPMDLLLVRKLGTPGNPELAMGAIASGGVRVLNDDVIAMRHIDRGRIEAAVTREAGELARREAAYRGQRARPNLRGKTVLLVDDGLATGATMRAAAQAIRQAGPAAVVVAVPTGARASCKQLEQDADQVICLEMPEPYYAVGMSYQVFDQTSDEEVRSLLNRAWSRTDPDAAAGEPGPAH